MSASVASLARIMAENIASDGLGAIANSAMTFQVKNEYHVAK